MLAEFEVLTLALCQKLALSLERSPIALATAWEYHNVRNPGLIRSLVLRFRGLVKHNGAHVTFGEFLAKA